MTHATITNRTCTAMSSRRTALVTIAAALAAATVNAVIYLVGLGERTLLVAGITS
jgi:hypothetical protein